MRFSYEELSKIADWAAVAPGFGRDRTTIDTHIGPILDRLAADERLARAVSKDGGTSNYFAFYVYPATRGFVYSHANSDVRRVPCVAVQLSLLAPVGVFGESTFFEGERFFASSNLEIEQVCDPASPPSWVAEAVIAATHGASAYRFVGRHMIEQLLPPGIEVYEYCLSAKPWNRVFHAMFADTD
ncbi:MAG TPA: hypothetical protein VIM11_08475 [Tepidisphaeraceae bacterium]|jgi:hypothetical protein